MDSLIPIGEYIKQFNDILNINLPCGIIYKSEGLVKHIEKRHPNFVCYLDRIAEIVKSPDYIGVNPREENSIELIKVFEHNILIAIKLDTSKNYLYVASLYDIKQSKLERRIHSNRIKRFKTD